MTWQPLFAAIFMSLIAWGLSRTLYLSGDPSIKRVLRTLIISSVIMIFVGTLLFIALYAMIIPDFASDWTGEPVKTTLFFLKLGLLTAFFWLPILLLTALAQARRVPKLK